jgi:hypothetical protein
LLLSSWFIAGSCGINGKKYKKTYSKMKKAILCFLVSFYSITAFCQHPYKQNLSGIASITFPDTPELKKVSSVSIYFLKYNKSSYFAQASPLQTGLRDLISNHNLDSVYTIFTNAVIASTKGHVFYKRDITVNDLCGIEFGFSFKARKNGKTYYDYQNVFYLNDFLVNYSYLSSDSLNKRDKNITDFFDTFKLNIKKSDIRQTNSPELAYIMGKVAGYLLIIGVIVSLGFGIVFIIKKIVLKTNE